MKPIAPALFALALAGCSSGPQLPPWRADILVETLPADCMASAAADAIQATAVVPGGLALVRSADRDVVLIASRSCLWTVAASGGPVEPLPTHGDGIAPTMVHATGGGIAFSSSLSGSVRAIDVDGAVTFNVSGLQRPMGVRLLPGGAALAVENGTGRVLRLGPNDEYRPRLVTEGLEDPVGIVVINATTGYVTERSAGRITRFRLDRFERTPVKTGLARPEGLTVLADGRLGLVETATQRVLAVDPVSGTAEVLAADLPVAPEDATPDPHAVADIAAAADGTLYVSSPRLRSVLKLTRRIPATGRP